MIINVSISKVLVMLFLMFVLIVLLFKFGFMVCFFIMFNGIGNVLVCNISVILWVLGSVKDFVIFFCLSGIGLLIIGVVIILLLSIIVSIWLMLLWVMVVNCFVFILFNLKVIIGWLV